MLLTAILMISPHALKMKELFAILLVLSRGAILILLKKMCVAQEIMVKHALII
jgi:hypothetical protein